MEWLILIPPLFWIAYTDYKNLIIPNLAIAIILLSALILHIYNGNITVFIGGFVGCFFILFIFFAVGAMGGGDVKLAAAVGATLGYWRGLNVIILALLLCVIAVTIQKIFRGELLSFLKDSFTSIKMLFLGQLKTFVAMSSKESVPLGVYFLPAALICFALESLII